MLPQESKQSIPAHTQAKIKTICIQFMWRHIGEDRLTIDLRTPFISIASLVGLDGYVRGKTKNDIHAMDPYNLTPGTMVRHMKVLEARGFIARYKPAAGQLKDIAVLLDKRGAYALRVLKRAQREPGTKRPRLKTEFLREVKCI